VLIFDSYNYSFISDMALYKVYSPEELESLSITSLDAILMGFSTVPREEPGSDQAYLECAVLVFIGIGRRGG
jgi:hypothetical protein